MYVYRELLALQLPSKMHQCFQCIWHGLGCRTSSRTCLSESLGISAPHCLPGICLLCLGWPIGASASACFCGSVAFVILKAAFQQHALLACRAIGIIEPFSTSLSSVSPMRSFAPNPLSYNPQEDMRITTQYMVRNIAAHCMFETGLHISSVTDVLAWHGLQTFPQRILNVLAFWKYHYFTDSKILQKSQRRL